MYMLDTFRAVLVLLLFHAERHVCFAAAAARTWARWKPDVVVVNASASRAQHGPASWSFGMRVNASGEIYDEEFLGGHYRVSFDLYNARLQARLGGTSGCVNLRSPARDAQAALAATMLSSSEPNATALYRADESLVFNLIRFGDGEYATGRSVYTELRLEGKEAYDLTIEFLFSGCLPVRTVGRWSDSYNWQGMQVPAASDDVDIPAGSGVILVPPSSSSSSSSASPALAVHDLRMSGGEIVGQQSGCYQNWSSIVINGVGTKCLKMFDLRMDYYESSQFCHRNNARLVQVESYDELGSLQGICRVPVASSTAADSEPRTFASGTFTSGGGCWIGLRDVHGNNTYEWDSPSYMVYRGFRDWRRTEVPDRDDPHGFIDIERRCVYSAPWQEDPLIAEQGSWVASHCSVKRSFVCEHNAGTMNRNIVVSGKASFSNESKLTGGSWQFKNVTTINSLVATRSAELFLNSVAGTYKPHRINTLRLERGSLLDIRGGQSVLSEGPAFIGEAPIASAGSYWIQPIVRISPASNWTFQPDSTHIGATIEARFMANRSALAVLGNHSLTLAQGGLISSGTLRLEASSSSLVLHNYAHRMVTYDSFDITLSQRGPVIGEYLNDPLREDVVPVGVYRIATRLTSSATAGAAAEVSACIPYNATSEQLRSILVSGSSLIRARGGLTVRRYGNGHAMFNFGYRYRVEVDANPTASFTAGSLSISLHCTGINSCGCAQTKVPLRDEFGLPTCLLSGNSSRSDPNACVIPPSVVVSRVSELSYIQTSGAGSVVVDGGVHRLPPIGGVDLGSRSGKAIVAADVVTWSSVSAVGRGTVLVVGTGWHGWDSADVLYDTDEEEGRGLNRLNTAPPCKLYSKSFRVSGGGAVLTAGPGTHMTWGSGVWMGGTLGGRGVLHVNQSMIANEGPKALKYAITLNIVPGARLVWTGGNLSLSNGADIVVEGSFIVNISTADGFIGQAQLMRLSGSANNSALLDSLENADFNGYFDDVRAAEVRKAWYINPACGAECYDDSHIILKGHSTFIVQNNSKATFVSPLDLKEHNKFFVNRGGELNLNAGGICGNDVVMEVSESSQVILSGGSFSMDTLCTITGAGELSAVNGTHDLSKSINAHITISGGVMYWPERRGAKSTLRFYGGLLINGTGKLFVEPLETNIIVDKVVEFKDKCLVQFPMIGIAALPSLYDTVDAPDASPRGSLTATYIMRWGGGTLKGKADINVGSILYLEGGEKHIESLAKLVNRGHAEWSKGDIVTADQGDFVNLGTVQMSNGTTYFNSNMRAEGTIVPKESGGDAFALDFHSWDLDQGSLDFQEYVRLRTEFVSRAPNGWTEDLQ